MDPAGSLGQNLALRTDLPTLLLLLIPLPSGYGLDVGVHSVRLSLLLSTL